MKAVCVFCGAHHGHDPAFSDSARRLGRAIAGRGLTLVNGGGNVGLMNEVSNAALQTGGEVIGVIPESLVARELAHRGLTRLEVVSSMAERKDLMAGLSDAFIALPGGFGTMDELCEVLTWTQLGFQRKPSGLLEVNGFFSSFVAFLDHATESGFIKSAYRTILSISEDPDDLLEELSLAMERLSTLDEEYRPEDQRPQEGQQQT